LENLDHLFDKPHLSAAIDPGSPNLSSGIMVIEPKRGALKELLDVIPEVKASGIISEIKILSKRVIKIGQIKKSFI
jgi:hypothetical protein